MRLLDGCFAVSQLLFLVRIVLWLWVAHCSLFRCSHPEFYYVVKMSGVVIVLCRECLSVVSRVFVGLSGVGFSCFVTHLCL